MQRVHFSIEKQAPVTNGSTEHLELFHGIGNKLGFNITGGSDFNMPLTIFCVSRPSAVKHFSSSFYFFTTIDIVENVIRNLCVCYWVCEKMSGFKVKENFHEREEIFVDRYLFFLNHMFVNTVGNFALTLAENLNKMLMEEVFSLRIKMQGKDNF